MSGDGKPEGPAATEGIRPEPAGRMRQELRSPEASEDRLTADLAGMNCLFSLYTQLAGETDLRVALEKIVEAACDFTGTDRGYVQLMSEDGERLELFATRGYKAGSPLIAHIQNYGSKPAYDGARLIIADLETFPSLAGTMDREAALADGVRAAQSTPIIGHDGALRGVLSNQFRAPYRPDDGHLRLMDLLAWTAADFIARHKTNAALEESEQRHRALLGELQHRVRNSLAVMRSIARRTAANSETVEDFSMHLDGRLASFARTQGALAGNPSGAIDLRGIVIDELAAHAAREGDQVYVTGPDIMLQPKAGETLALAFHELATNAIKFGSLSVDQGMVRISWAIAPDSQGRDQLTLRWDEERPGSPLSPPTLRGFGMELLEDTLAYELEAETFLDFRPNGLLCTIIFPLAGHMRALA